VYLSGREPAIAIFAGDFHLPEHRARMVEQFQSDIFPLKSGELKLGENLAIRYLFPITTTRGQPGCVTLH
jgi:hypothetical protein